MARSSPVAWRIAGWIAAGASVALAVAVRTEPASPVLPAASESPAAVEARQLRLALDSTRAQSESLREELDRHLEARQQEGRTPPAAASPAADDPAPGAPPDPRFGDLAGQWRDAVARVAAGDESAADAVYETVMELIRGGPSAFPALRDAYLSTADPEARAIMSRAFVASLGPEAAAFVASELTSAADPRLEEALALRAEQLTTPVTAPILRDGLLHVLISGAATTDARAAAVRGLRHLRPDPAVDQAILQAARSGPEPVRLAAMEQMARRPSLRGALRALVASEPDSRIGSIARCRLLLSAARPQPNGGER